MHKIDEEYCSTVQELLLKTLIFKSEMGIGLIKPDSIKNVRLAGTLVKVLLLLGCFEGMIYFLTV